MVVYKFSSIAFVMYQQLIGGKFGSEGWEMRRNATCQLPMHVADTETKVLSSHQFRKWKRRKLPCTVVTEKDDTVFKWNNQSNLPFWTRRRHGDTVTARAWRCLVWVWPLHNTRRTLTDFGRPENSYSDNFVATPCSPAKKKHPPFYSESSSRVKSTHFPRVVVDPDPIRLSI